MLRWAQNWLVGVPHGLMYGLGWVNLNHDTLRIWHVGPEIWVFRYSLAGPIGSFGDNTKAVASRQLSQIS